MAVPQLPAQQIAAGAHAVMTVVQLAHSVPLQMGWAADFVLPGRDHALWRYLERIAMPQKVMSLAWQVHVHYSPERMEDSEKDLTPLAGQWPPGLCEVKQTAGRVPF